MVSVRKRDSAEAIVDMQTQSNTPISSASGKPTPMSEAETDFSKYLVSQWTKLSLPHSYQEARKSTSKTFESLGDASRAYEFGGKTLSDTEKLLNDLSQRLDRLLGPGDGDCHKLHHLCLEILEWGGVEGTSSRWLRERCDARLLAFDVRRARDELSGDTSPDSLACSVFAAVEKHDRIPMNSGTTKIFALAQPQKIAIYDGRVGAGLAMLTKRFLQSPDGKNHQQPDSRNAVPRLLQWGWGDGQATSRTVGRRNPNSPGFWFPCLNRGKNADIQHAVYAWRASRLLRKVASDLTSATRSAAVSLADIERGLFVIGYDIRQR